ncbi:ATP-binding protein [Streptomyces sp. TRM72054]|uniref:ATP-binding protein n=1 Tax=Streptomyces sp. TRM72054 TaxID=2870562 RepID=UPI0027E0D661|nr:ATP-binding protein [Streptomyces sp. TRM72054]
MNEYFPLAYLAPRPVQYRMSLTVGEHSARHIRRIVRSLLTEWEMPDLTDAVELGVTELVANVVRHVPDRRCTLLLVRQKTGARVEVSDGSPQLPFPSTTLSPDAENGRGLVLLDAVADKWGVEPSADGGKTVWFECELAGVPLP